MKFKKSRIASKRQAHQLLRGHAHAHKLHRHRHLYSFEKDIGSNGEDGKHHYERREVERGKDGGGHHGMDSYDHNGKRFRHHTWIEDITEKALSKLKVGTTDDTSVHQLNRLYCMVLFIGLAIFSGSSQFVGEPISCWCPAEFEKFHVKYVNAYCWIANTYTVPFDDIIPKDYAEREEEEIKYYQWVPIIFVFQAFLFFLPRMFWKHCNGYSGLNLKKVLFMADEATLVSPEEREEKVGVLAEHLDRWIIYRDTTVSSHQKVTKVKETIARGGIHRANFLSILYLFTDILYLGGTIAQLFFLDAVLGVNYKSIGLEFYNFMFEQKKWEENMKFPRVTFCDFDLRQMTNLQRWTVQCSLPINLYNEKTFVIVWFVLVIVSLINCIHFIYNTVVFFFPRRKMEYVEKYLTLSTPKYYSTSDDRAQNVAQRFVDMYLKNDGVFVIWLVTNNTSPVIASELIDTLWVRYCKTEAVQEYLKKDVDDHFA
ncbi:hypothetical protein FSP39_001457 [Pinctada imbricata]|uniref:Innexin n=1 Tax=Pinctada imbricata TaxID=66713 RepID=A0AA89BHJ5_PINIB|nr:hypothetical protein FSP39_001457 [Pinctada imbricata]